MADLAADGPDPPAHRTDIRVEHARGPRPAALRAAPAVPRGRHIRQSRGDRGRSHPQRSEEHTSELQSLMRISYAVFCSKKKKKQKSCKTRQHNKYNQTQRLTKKILLE